VGKEFAKVAKKTKIEIKTLPDTGFAFLEIQLVDFYRLINLLAAAVEVAQVNRDFVYLDIPSPVTTRLWLSWGSEFLPSCHLAWQKEGMSWAIFPRRKV
jgi:hypothetical protein